MKKASRRLSLFLVSSAMLLALASCQTKQSAISDLRSLSQEMTLYGDNYSINDWKEAGQRYYEINKRIRKHTGDYTNAEMQEIGELNGKCVRSFTEGAVTKVQGAVATLKSFIEGFLK